MKKIFLAVIFLLIFSVCSAAKEFSLGKVELDMPYDKVIEICGQPTSIPGGYAQLVSNVIMYDDAVEIGFLGKNVRYIVTTIDNGWTTPAGVRVGMNLAEVVEIYGDDYEILRRAPGDIPKWMIESGKPYFDYNWSGTMYSWRRADKILSVVVDAENSVRIIRVMKILPEN